MPTQITVPVTILQQAVSIAVGALVAFSPLSYGAKCNGVDDDLPGLIATEQKCADAVAAGGRKVTLDLCGRTYWVSTSWNPSGMLSHVNVINGRVMPLGTLQTWAETDQAIIDWLAVRQTVTQDGKTWICQKPLVNLGFSLNTFFSGVDLDGNRIAAGLRTYNGKPNSRRWEASYILNCRTYSIFKQGGIRLSRVWVRPDAVNPGPRDAYGIIYNSVDNQWDQVSVHHCHCPIMFAGATLFMSNCDIYNGYVDDDDQPAPNPRLYEYRKEANTITWVGGRMGNGVRHHWGTDMIIQPTKFGYTGGVDADAVFVFYATEPEQTLGNFGLYLTETPFEIKNGDARWIKWMVEPAEDGQPANSWAMDVDVQLGNLNGYLEIMPGLVQEVLPGLVGTARRYVSGGDHSALEFTSRGTPGNRRPSFGGKGSRVYLGYNGDRDVMSIDTAADVPALEPRDGFDLDLGTLTKPFRQAVVQHWYQPVALGLPAPQPDMVGFGFDGYALTAVLPSGQYVDIFRVGYAPEPPAPPPPVPVITQLLNQVADVVDAEGVLVYVVRPGIAELFQDAAGTIPATPLSDVSNIAPYASTGGHAIQATPADAPSLVTIPNGNTALDFNDVALEYLLSPLGSGSSGHFIAVGRVNVLVQPAGIMGNRSTGPTGNAGVVLRAGTITAGNGYQMVIGNLAGVNVAEIVAPLSEFVVLSGYWTPTEVGLRINGGAYVTTPHNRDATSAIQIALGKHRPSGGSGGAQGEFLLFAQHTEPLPEDGTRWIERLGAHLSGASLAYDQEPVLADFNAYQTTATKWVDIPYADKSWSEDTAGGATWYAKMDVYQSTVPAPPGGRKVLTYWHPNGSTKAIFPGGSVDTKILQPALAAGFDVVAIEFPHPVASRIGLGAAYLTAYDYMGWAVQKVRSMAAAFNWDVTKVGAVTRSRGSMAIGAALFADKKADVGTHQERQSSVLQAIWTVNGQTLHDLSDAADRFVLEAERAQFVLDNPSDPGLFNWVDMVAAAPQRPDLYLVSNDAYYGTLQPAAVLEANLVHYPDMHLAMKQEYTAAGISSKLTDLTSVASADEYVGMTAWFTDKLA